MRLEGLSEKIFLDRYAKKHPNGQLCKLGDTVLVLVKDDPKFPTKEVGVVTARQGNEVTVQLRGGDSVETTADKLVLPLEVTPTGMWNRLAESIASAEERPDKRVEWEGRFLDALQDWKLVPGGRIMAGAGASDELTLFNCYVVPSPKDSRGGIMTTLGDMTEIMARGGGVGMNLSSLRPRRAVVAGVNGSSSGSVSWGGLFSYATGLIEQGGSRRGALMIMLNDWHPDLLEFITVKQKMGEVTNANLSVCVSDAFMDAVKRDLEWELVFPDTKETGYDELWDGDLAKWRELGKRVVTYRKLPAREIWHVMMESAWRSAEPGVVFMERYNKKSNSWYFNPIVSTNPCGEQGLPGWGVCNLSAVNLSQFYDAKRGGVDWDELAQVTQSAVRFLDNVIDKTPYHFEQNERNQKLERRIGLGTMGLAELMIKLGIRYGGEESIDFLDRLFGFIAKEAYLASSRLAAEKGSFPAFDADLYLQSGFMKELVAAYPEVGEAIRRDGIRNVTVLTQAPTGSTGTMVGTSTGIEPYFAFEYYRQSRLGYDKQLVPIAQQWLDEHPGEELPDYFVTAMSLSAEDHIRVQATIQRWVDSSISKTANCPADFTVEETKHLYELAYDLGCKGVTIYRDGSRDVQVLSAGEKESSVKDVEKSDAESQEKAESPTEFEQTGNLTVPSTFTDTSSRENPVSVDKQYKRRPSVLRGATYKMNTPFGMAYITINDLDGSPAEIFLNVGKAGSDVFAMAEALGRVCSLFLRYGDHGSKVKLLVKHLKGIGGTGAIGFGPNRVESIADAVAKALEMHIEGGREPLDVVFQSEMVSDELAAAQAAANGTGVYPNYATDSETGSPRDHFKHKAAMETHPDLCPSCGSATLMSIEGCKQCTVCGFSKCN
ncbi:ribonucleoside-diphosphate reductase, adenosylcobalamin-dependent [Paenibacillus agaridevorans]|uniref:Vitamin B12-dependent ribonucleotide reductase n=1 Tax=Paenibacillus agaridevorans TaxID=171404 RepID=A0A2R5EHQ3_9BACL|nr:adenosylcobalamin-dependent ribonucleoside-diphosphate reductase [Paenibacillus agaridevorans]GBG06102.1 ribonucleoside-diphosphate reductase, adenosylcobalamin-dependent [Paenibacillus agaridevorans]